MIETKVEFGCGTNKLEGWASHDYEVPIEGRLPYTNESVDRIRAEHVCEHVTPAQFLHFLDECKRILKPRGRIRLCMPSLTRLDPVHGRDIILGHGHQGAYNVTLIMDFLRIAGFQSIVETGRDPEDHHHTAIGMQKDDLETVRIEAIK